MWIKGLGGVILLFVALLGALGYATQERRIARRLAIWVSLLEKVRGSIACFATPLDAIYGELDEATVKLLTQKEKHECRDLTSLCQISAPLVKGESQRILKELGDELGSSWREEQIQRLDHYISALERERCGFVTRLGDRTKLSVALSVCAALGVILLFW